MSDSEEERVEKQLKVVFVGESCVGKVSAAVRWVWCGFNCCFRRI